LLGKLDILLGYKKKREKGKEKKETLQNYLFITPCNGMRSDANKCM